MALKGAVICISGTLSRSRKDMTSLLQAHGAAVTTSVTDKVTHVLTSASDAASKTSEVSSADAAGIPVIGESFVAASIESGSLAEAGIHYPVDRQQLQNQVQSVNHQAPVDDPTTTTFTTSPPLLLGNVELHDEVLAAVCQFLGVRELGRLACVSRRFTGRTLAEPGCGVLLSPIEEGARLRLVAAAAGGGDGRVARHGQETWLRALWWVECHLVSTLAELVYSRYSDAALRVVEIMNSAAEYPGVQKEGCRSLRYIADGGCGSAPNKAHVAEAGGIEAVLLAMRAHGGVADVQEHGCATLNNVAARHRVYRRKALQAGCVEVVLAAMCRHDSVVAVQEQGCAALSFLTNSECPDAKREIVQAEGVETVLAAMRAHDGAVGVQEHGCLTLWNLAYNSPPNQRAITQLGGIELVRQAREVADSTWQALERQRKLPNAYEYYKIRRRQVLAHSCAEAMENADLALECLQGKS